MWVKKYSLTKTNCVKVSWCIVSKSLIHVGLLRGLKSYFQISNNMHLCMGNPPERLPTYPNDFLIAMEEKIRPKTPTTTANIMMNISKAMWYHLSLFHLSFKWKIHGKIKVMHAPKTLPNTPIRSPKRGTAKAIPKVENTRMTLDEKTQRSLNPFSLKQVGSFGSSRISIVPLTINIFTG